MVELPEYVKTDIYMKKYTKLNQDNTIIGMWERKPHKSDFNEEVTLADGSTKILTHYHGEWAPVPDEEIKRLNEEMKKNKKVLTNPNQERMSSRERDLEAARKLLAELVAAHGGEQ